MKRGLGIALLAALITAVALIARRASPPQFIVNGKPVTDWALDLSSPSAPVREQAERIFRELGPEATPTLSRMARTRDSALSVLTITFSKRLPAKTSSRLMRIVNPYQGRAQRAAAAQALRIMGLRGVGAVPALARALPDDQGVSWYAALALAEMGEAGLDALIGAAPRVDPVRCGFVCHAIGTQGAAASNAIPVLDAILRASTPQTAQIAARALGNIGRRAAPVLLRNLEDKDPQVRIRAAIGLGTMGALARDAVPRLIEAARTDNPQVRAAIVLALGQIRPWDPTVEAALIVALKDEDSKVRMSALTGLTQVPATATNAVPILIDLLKDRNSDIRGQASLLLGLLGNASASVTNALSNALRDPNETVRTEARQALDRLKSR